MSDKCEDPIKTIRYAGESCANCAYISCSSYGKKSCGCPSYDRGPGAPEPVSVIPAQWMTRLEYAFGETREKISTMILSEVDDPDDDIIDDWRDWQFVAWGEKYVYFPRESCGYHYVGFVSRHPCADAKLE